MPQKASDAPREPEYGSVGPVTLSARFRASPERCGLRVFRFSVMPLPYLSAIPSEPLFCLHPTERNEKQRKEKGASEDEIGNDENPYGFA